MTTSMNNIGIPYESYIFIYMILANIVRIMKQLTRSDIISEQKTMFWLVALVTKMFNSSYLHKHLDQAYTVSSHDKFQPDDTKWVLTQIEVVYENAINCTVQILVLKWHNIVV